MNIVPYNTVLYAYLHEKVLNFLIDIGVVYKFLLTVRYTRT